MVNPITMASLPHNHTSTNTTAGEQGTTTPDSSSEKKEPYLSDESEDGEEQEGVRQMSAITQTWDKKSLIMVYIWYVPHISLSQDF